VAPAAFSRDYATADILTKGRTVFGVGRGYHSREVETFGAPIIDQEATANVRRAGRDRLKGSQRILFAQGKHYAIPADVPIALSAQGADPVPRPVNLPVECWQPIVSASTRGIEFMLRHGHQGPRRRGLQRWRRADQATSALRTRWP